MTTTSPAEKIASWTSPNGDITIQLWALHTGVWQVRELRNGGASETPEPFATEGEARAIARAKAEIIRFNQTGR